MSEEKMCFSIVFEDYELNGCKFTLTQQRKSFVVFSKDFISTMFIFAAIMGVCSVIYCQYWVILTDDVFINRNEVLSSCLAVSILGCFIIFVTFRSKTVSESLLIVPTTGISLKRVNVFGQQSSTFYQMTQIKDIVIMEGFTKLTVICYLALQLNDNETIIPLFESFHPEISVLKEIYKKSRALLSKNG